MTKGFQLRVAGCQLPVTRVDKEPNYKKTFKRTTCLSD